MVIIKHQMKTIIPSKDNEAEVDTEVAIVEIIEVAFVVMTETITPNSTKQPKIQMLITHHPQIPIDVIEILLFHPDNHNSRKTNSMWEIGMVKH